MKTKNYIIIGGIAVAVAAAGYYADRPASSAANQSTDDAYLTADFTNVAPQTSGVIATVQVAENQPVAAGDVLMTLDDRQPKAALDAAKAGLGSALANLATAQGAVNVQTAVIAQAEANLRAAQASAGLAQIEADRSRKLVAQESAAQRTLDQALATLTETQAKVDVATAALTEARADMTVTTAKVTGAEAAVAEAKAAQEKAELTLSYTQVTAPVSGVVGRLSARVGNFAQTGGTQMSIVPLERIYIVANYRETQLANVAPGQSVSISVDALPGQRFAGTVDSIGPASGVSFSSVAPQNATGNFTKVTQRLPVRIALTAGQTGMDKMRVGMSVEPEIHTR